MARTTILRYAKYAGSRNKVANKTIKHGFRLHNSNGIGVDDKKTKNNLYFIFNDESNSMNKISHDKRSQVLVKFNQMYNALEKEHNNNPRLKEFEKKHAKTPWLVESVKTYSPILFQEWGIAEIGKVNEEIIDDDLTKRFKIKNDGYYLKKIINQDKLNQWATKVINEEVSWQRERLNNDAGIVGAVVHLDERNIHIHFYSFPINEEKKLKHTKLFDKAKDLSARQKSFWEWSRDNIDSTIEKYKSKTISNASNKNFKQWHYEQRENIKQETLNFHAQSLAVKNKLNKLNINKEHLIKCLLKDISSQEKSLVQNLINAIEQLENYYLLSLVAKTTQEKNVYHQQIAAWSKKS